MRLKRIDLVGNKYTIYTYDNTGIKTLEIHGDKINISGNRVKIRGADSDGNWNYIYELSSVINITINGKEIQSCGDTCIFEGDGLKQEVDFTQDKISSTSDSITDATSTSSFINQYKNAFGKSCVVVIKSQLGQPICAYSGDDVYWEISDNLPKTTKLMIDGKPLYIHRANFQIIDKGLLE